MTEEEKLAAEAKAQADKDAAIAEAIEADPVAQKDALITKLTIERDNYKNVALKRLGKLSNDADFIAGEDGTEMTVAEQIKIALLDKEIDSEKKAKDELYTKTLRENAELKLALKNRPQGSIGGDSTTTVAVKDNVLTDAQIADLTAKANRLKADPEKFIENFKKTLLIKIKG